ncbi:hypothetical protein ACT6NV_08180 [Robiginitalea sp. IMCC44478]|uniref:hypothetical protein n=1 Tax=Robiginitalea sp. IMCC44478 TaxID=3459122 RepID=UPI004042EF04
MRPLLLSILLICGIFSTRGQTDVPETKKLRIEAKPDKGVNLNPNKGPGLSLPPGFGTTPNFDLKDSKNKSTVNMLPERELKQAGHDLVLKPNMGEGEKGNSGKHFGDMYLGDVKSSSKFVGIVCRDHEFVDGDRVRIYLNGVVVEPNILLTGSFKGLNLDLDKGFNRLDFEALNQGSSGPNTAQVDVYDELGKLIYSNKWLLSTGSKASLIIVRDN